MQKENNFVKAKENGITGSRSTFKTVTPHGDCRAALPSGEQASGSTLATITAGDTGPTITRFESSTMLSYSRIKE